MKKPSSKIVIVCAFGLYKYNKKLTSCSQQYAVNIVYIIYFKYSSEARKKKYGRRKCN